MSKLHISRFTTRILIIWTVLLCVMLLGVNLVHAGNATPVTFHALTWNGFLASLLMGLRLIVLFLVFSTIPMRWPITLLTFLSLTVGVVAISQWITVIMAGHIGLILLFLIFVVAFCGLLYTSILITSETIQGNNWDEDHPYLISWFQSLLNSVRRFSLPLLGTLLVFSLTLALVYHVTF